MKQVFVAADNVITSLGFSTEENLAHIRNSVTGIRLCNDPILSVNPFYASLISTEALEKEFSSKTGWASASHTRFEKLCFLSLTDALSKIKIDTANKNTLFILSTTKGNIDLLEKEKSGMFEPSRVNLWNTARLIATRFNNPNEAVVISNACISGLLAVIMGSRLIQAGLYENVVITGCDILSEFVVSGFLSFQSLSPGPCMPFDANRNGLSLGEGAGTIVLTSDKNLSCYPELITVGAGASANDANHISGPSRTGDGLFLAVSRVLSENHIAPEAISFISAHGTATPYNDEMETQALTRAGLNSSPVNSFKGYFGHTLGAAGVIESVLGIHSILNNELYNTLGYNNHGVTEPLNVINKFEKRTVNNCLKLASGFGGCNSAVIYKRDAGNN